MKFLTGCFRLLYDLVIGDCWQIAAGAVVVLSSGVGALKIGALPTAMFAVVLGITIMGAAALIIYFDARATYHLGLGTE